MRFVVLLIASLSLMTSAQGEGCHLTTSQADVDTGPLTGPAGVRHYLVDDCFISSCSPPFSNVHVDGTFYIYEESNGIDGLQRADEIADDTCGGRVGVGDTIIF